MARNKKLKPVVVGSVVAFNDLENAAWFEVLGINGFDLTIREEGKPDYAEQHIDKAFVKQVK